MYYKEFGSLHAKGKAPIVSSEILKAVFRAPELPTSLDACSYLDSCPRSDRRKRPASTARRSPASRTSPSTPRIPMPPITTTGDIIGAGNKCRSREPQRRRAIAINATAVYRGPAACPPTQASTASTTSAGTPTTPKRCAAISLEKGWKVPTAENAHADGSRAFRVNDPEGNQVEFRATAANPKPPDAPIAIGHHIIHVGFLVHSREAEDKFYRDLLGFRPYWFGGMQEGKSTGSASRAPDSHDWLEYMLTYAETPICPGTGIPAGISQHDLGVLDHLSIGVVSVDGAYKTLSCREPPYRRIPTGPSRRSAKTARPVQPLRPRWNSPGADELPRHRKALLLALHRG